MYSQYQLILIVHKAWMIIQMQSVQYQMIGDPSQTITRDFDV